MALLDTFLNNPFTEPFQSNIGQQAGYTGSGLDLLLEQARRNKNIRENRIFDYVQVENDPNFSRGAAPNSKILEKYTADLGIVTQMVTVVNSSLAIAGVQEYIPSNVRSLLQNFQALADTNINSLQSIKQLVSAKQIEKAFLSDLTIQFGNKTITFDQIALMADRVATNVQSYDSVQNTGIRPLLSIGLQQFLPTDVAAIFDDAEYLDMLANMFGDQSPNIALVNSLFTDTMNTYADTRIDDIVTVERYQDVPLTLDDPLGTSLHDEFRGELETDYVATITQMVEDNPYFDASQKQTVIDFLVEDAGNNLDLAFRGNIALPSLTAVVNAAVSESHNTALDGINQSFEKIAVSLLNKIGAVPAPSGTKSIDYLQNLKRNLKKRMEMRRIGDTSDNFTEIEAYLKSVLLNKDLSEARLTALNDYIDSLTEHK